MDTVIFGIETQALGILRQIAGMGFSRIFLFDKDSFGVARFSRYTRKVFRTPEYTDHKSMLEFFIEFGRINDLDSALVFPTDDEQVKFLAKHREQLKPYYRITLPKWDKIKRCHYKNELNKLAYELNIPFPKTISDISFDDNRLEGLKYPVVIKPSAKEDFLKLYRKKAIECRNREELDMWLADIQNNGIDLCFMLIQEIIPGLVDRQYSISGLAWKGEVKRWYSANRVRQHPLFYGKASTYVKIEDLSHTPMPDHAELLIKSVEFSGPFEIEFKYHDSYNSYMLLDFNLRFWGWHYILSDDFNLPLEYCNLISGKETDYNKTSDYKKEWMNFITDLPISIQFMKKGLLLPGKYFSQLMKSKQAIWDLRDPLPFVLQLILIPYLILKRGV